MAALVEVGDLHEQLGCSDGVQQRNGVGLHPADDDEGLCRSYVCSMSSTIDLGGHESGNYADLTLNVQRYLSRIVEELHLISAWSSSVCHRQQQRSDVDSVVIEKGKRIDDSALTAMARLAVVTDIELMRRDVAKAQHQLFQRCTAQMAYVQSEASTAISKQDTLVNELQQRVDATQRAWEQQVQVVQALEKARAESDAQLRSMASTLRQVQQQTAAHPTRISELEKSLATVTTMQFSHDQDLQTLQRRVERYETAHQLQLENTRRSAEDSLAALRSSHSQLSAKMQVLRLELQELSESTQKRLQQMLKSVNSVASSVPGKPILGPGAAVPPRRPSVSTPRTPRAGGNTASNQASQVGAINSPKDGGNSTQTVMVTGADAMGMSDCFIYAKAALPHRNSIADTTLSTKKPVAPSTGSSRGLVTSGGGSSTSSSATDSKAQDAMTNLLTVQQSVMSVPLGFEDDTRPATLFNIPAKDNTDPRDPILPTRRSAHRHHSLPDVNLALAQGAPSPHKFQASRLNLKQK